IDWGVLLFAFVASGIVGVAFGLAPVMQIRRLDLVGTLKLEGRGAICSREQQRTRRILVIAECALSLALMTAAGLLLRSFWKLAHPPLGSTRARVAVVHAPPPYRTDPAGDLYRTVAAEARFVREVARRAKELPGVLDVAIGSGAAVPLDHPPQNQTLVR